MSPAASLSFSPAGGDGDSTRACSGTRSSVCLSVSRPRPRPRARARLGRPRPSAPWTPGVGDGVARLHPVAGLTPDEAPCSSDLGASRLRARRRRPGASSGAAWGSRARGCREVLGVDVQSTDPGRPRVARIDDSEIADVPQAFSGAWRSLEEHVATCSARARFARLGRRSAKRTRRRSHRSSHAAAALGAHGPRYDGRRPESARERFTETRTRPHGYRRAGGDTAESPRRDRRHESRDDRRTERLHLEERRVGRERRRVGHGAGRGAVDVVHRLSDFASCSPDPSLRRACSRKNSESREPEFTPPASVPRPRRASMPCSVSAASSRSIARHVRSRARARALARADARARRACRVSSSLRLGLAGARARRPSRRSRRAPVRARVSRPRARRARLAAVCARAAAGHVDGDGAACTMHRWSWPAYPDAVALCPLGGVSPSVRRRRVTARHAPPGGTRRRPRTWCFIADAAASSPWREGDSRTNESTASEVPMRRFIGTWCEGAAEGHASYYTICNA